MLICDMPTTHERRNAIRTLLSQEPVASQADLAQALAERGFSASQPMLSRDLRALKVAKRDGAYRLLEDEHVTPLSALKSLLRGATPVAHLGLVRCEPGSASAVARALEAEEIEGVVGSVAGDDTVLFCTDSKAAVRRVCERVGELL
jgi:transcriptional regulator of arginine metabolism